MHGSLRVLLLAGTLALSLPVLAQDLGNISKLNGAIEIDAQQHAGAVSSVNGSVRIADGASVERAHTVNGSIRLGEHARARQLEAVNGSIELRRDAQVSGDVDTVNGRIDLQPGVEVSGHVSNVNGHIQLDQAHVAGGLETTAGDITVGARSRVEGGIRVNRDHGRHHNRYNDKPRIVIGPDASVSGTLDFERPVELYVSHRAHIGPVKGATVHYFDGDRPM